MSDLLLVGSDHIFREALAIVLGHQLPDCRVSGQASTCAEVAQLLGRALPVDVAIVDLDDRLGNAVELVRQLVGQRPGVAVIALTTVATAELEFQLRLAGAAQVIDKSVSLATMLERIGRARRTRTPDDMELAACD